MHTTLFLRQALLSLGIITVGLGELKSATYEYSGPGGSNVLPVSGSWDADGSWVGGLKPVSGATTGLLFGNSGSNIYTATNDFGGSFSLNQLTLSSSSSGLTTIAGGTLNFVVDGVTAPQLMQNGSGAVTISNGIALGGNLTVGGSGAGLLTLSGAISGSNDLIKSGSGSVELSNTNGYTGNTVLNGGTLIVSDFDNIGDGSGFLDFNGGTLQWKTGSASDNSARAMRMLGAGTIYNDNQVTFSGAVTGSGALAKNGVGRLVFSSANSSWAGAINVNAGTLVGRNSNRALGTGVITLGGGNLWLLNDTGLSFGNNVVVSSNAAISSGILTGGEPAVTHTLGTLSIGGQTLTVSEGLVSAVGTSGLSFGATTLTGNATFSPNANTQLTLASMGLGANTATFTGDGNSTVSGAISGTGGNLIKNGVGSLTLTGNNTFTGNVTLSIGMLIVGNTNTSLGTGVATLTLNGGVLDLNNTGSGGNATYSRNTTITNDVTIISNRGAAGAGVTSTLGTLAISSQTLTVNAGSNATSGTAVLAFGATTTSGNSIFNVISPGGGVGTQLNLTGLLTLGGNLTVQGTGNFNTSGGLALSGGDRTLTLNHSGTTVTTTFGATALGSNTLTVQGSANSIFNNAISGTGGFTKSGSGIATFSGTSVANTYSGLTTVSGGQLDLSKNSGVNAIAGNATVGNGTIRLLQQNQIADTSTVSITAGGTFNLNNFSETVAAFNISSSGVAATLDLGTSGKLLLTGATPSVTFGANTLLTSTGIGSASINASTATSPLTLNFTGGQVSGGQINIGGASALTSTTFNISSGMGGGTFVVGGSGNSVDTVLTVNLSQTGTMNLGSTILAYSNGSGGRATILNVNIANTATGMSGGIISPALVANLTDLPGSSPVDLKNTLANTLTFAAGGSGFTLSGGIIDVRSSANTAGLGAITTNGNNLTISGGTLLGNSLVSTTGNLTLSSGYLGLRNAIGANFTISPTAVSDGRTIQMVSGNTGTFTVGSSSAATATTQKIVIANQSSGGVWDVGTINAGPNYTITNSSYASPFSASTASYSIAANSGLNGIVMGTSAIPTLLTLGANSSFFVASSSAAARTYNVGVGGANDIQVASSGGFTFGINNTTVANTQIINLNRDKGNDAITLVSNGASASSAVNIATNQTGSGNLYVTTRNLTLNSGVTFGGTGSILTDRLPGNSSDDGALSNFAGNIAGANAVGITFTINGILNGTNTVNLNQDAGSLSSFVVGSTAVIGGTQTWTALQNSATSAIFSNNLTNAANWTNGSVSFTTRGSWGTFEASTSTASPSAASNFKFNSLTLFAGSGAPYGAYKFVNNVQNDGGIGKEAIYAGSLAVLGGIQDGSNGFYLLNLNGQDLYVDSFANITGTQSRGLSFQNDSLNSVSEIRGIVSTSTLVGGSFSVLNGATLQFNGGDVNNVIYQRNTGNTTVADTAMAPNVGTGGSPDFRRTLAWDGTGVGGNVGTFTSFLGSGTANGGNTGSTFGGTNGTVRIIGGNYSSSGYILNPVGTIGLIDTTGTGDAILNDVLIRGNTATDSGGAGNATAFPALIIAGTTTVNGNLILANAAGATNQATLRVGGVTASVTPTALNTALLNVTGDLTVGSTNNLAIQSNATVKVGGNVSIAGVGVNLAQNVTGLGVGINAASHFTLNGNKGSATPQTVNIVPTVGNFHVGDGSGGTLTGTAAQASLTANLTAATSADINGVTSSLNLGGYNLSVGGGSGTLNVGGMLLGNGTVTGNVSVLNGGTHAVGNSPGFQTISGNAGYAAGSTFAWDLTQNIAFNTIQSGTAPFDQVQVNGNLSITNGALFTITLNGSGSSVNFTDSFWATNQSWLVVNVNGTGSGDFTLGGVSFDSMGQASSSYGYFEVKDMGGDIFVSWNAAVIPEPSSATLLLIGTGVGFVLLRRRRLQA